MTKSKGFANPEPKLTYPKPFKHVDMPQPSKAQYLEFNQKLRELVIEMFPGLSQAYIMYITQDLIHERNQSIREYIRETGDYSLLTLLESFGHNYEDCPESMTCADEDAEAIWEKHQHSWDKLVDRYQGEDEVPIVG